MSPFAFDPTTRVALGWLLHADPVAADRVIALRRRAIAGDAATQAAVVLAVEKMRSRYAQRGASRRHEASR
jgi:hypothetical protein